MDLSFVCSYLHVAENDLCNGSRNAHAWTECRKWKKEKDNFGCAVLALCLDDAPWYFGPAGISVPDSAVMCMLSRDQRKEKYAAPGPYVIYSFPTALYLGPLNISSLKCLAF